MSFMRLVNHMQSLEKTLETLLICIPVFNDWEPVTHLLQGINQVAGEWPFIVDVLLVDDGSTQIVPKPLVPRFANLRIVEILRLRRNLGHQRAITIGLSFIEDNRTCCGVIVMDGDGQDSPQDIGKLIERFEATKRQRVVFAKRERRSEDTTFQVFYQLFKVTHLILTGRRVEVGNFSIVPADYLKCLVVSSEMWNHYAASVFHARIPTDMVATTRGKRITGKSSMGFVSLVTHGWGAISVFSDVASTRLLIFTTAMICLALLSLSSVVFFSLFTGTPIPYWKTFASIAFVILATQAFATSLLFSFMALHRRVDSTFLPCRDYKYYVDKVEKEYFDG